MASREETRRASIVRQRRDKRLRHQDESAKLRAQAGAPKSQHWDEGSRPKRLVTTRVGNAVRRRWEEISPTKPGAWTRFEQRHPVMSDSVRNLALTGAVVGGMKLRGRHVFRRGLKRRRERPDLARQDFAKTKTWIDRGTMVAAAGIPLSIALPAHRDWFERREKKKIARRYLSDRHAIIHKGVL